MVAGNINLAPLPSRITKARLDLPKLNQETQQFSVDTINRLKSIQQQVQDLQAQLDVFGSFVGLATSGPTGIDAGDGQVIGTSNRAAHADHQHDVNTGAASAIGGANAEGSSIELARADHNHKIQETSGPTQLTVGGIEDTDTPRRTGSVLIGRTDEIDVLTGDLNNSTTTLSDVFTFALKANRRYVLKVDGIYQTAAATTALRLALTYTGTSSGRQFRIQAQTTAAGAWEFSSTTNFATQFGTANGGTGINALFFMYGWVDVVNAGTLKLQFASEVAASQVTLKDATSMQVISV